MQNNIGEEEAILVLRHEIGGTSARLCIIYKQSTFTRLFFTQQKICYQIPLRKRHGEDIFVFSIASVGAGVERALDPSVTSPPCTGDLSEPPSPQFLEPTHPPCQECF